MNEDQKFMTVQNFPKLHDFFVTFKVSNSDSELFKFIRDCGNPEK